ncbi:hypothetical protein LINPERPRIM_LOCUS28542 [Linum perenne]
MREREESGGKREGKGKQVVSGEGVRVCERGECSSGGGFAPDRLRRVFKVRNSCVSVEDSRGSFGSDFRLTVSSGDKSHFVFLEKAQLCWLRDILKEAAGNRWVLPPSCSSASNRRTISVTHFVARGFRNLKIAESCKNGKSFFVLIPWDPMLGGWKSLLFAFQAWNPTPATPYGGKSFAEIVRRRSLSEGGRCSIEVSEEGRCIRVEDSGVAERLDFLSGCLVFRFSSPSEVVWPEFRRWAAASWGVAPDVPFSRLGDDLWLLDATSKLEVSRILALGKWRFGSISILADVWLTS